MVNYFPLHFSPNKFRRGCPATPDIDPGVNFELNRDICQKCTVSEVGLR